MSGLDTTTHLLYLLSAVCFVLGLHLMNSPASARRGNQLSGAGMTLAIVTTVVVLAHDRSSTAPAV
ncbi:MAG TPA: NAD(P)(+) transhydrogenase (Re/Si-specific) subunit beta, partial [Mycobacteriales bacterium]